MRNERPFGESSSGSSTTSAASSTSTTTRRASARSRRPATSAPRRWSTTTCRILEKRGLHPPRPRGLPRDRGAAAAARRRSRVVPVPIIGTIAAGQPIPVPSADTWSAATQSDTIEVSPDMVGNRDNVFALRVKGTSMIDALVNDGDIVILESDQRASDGDMVAAWLKTRAGGHAQEVLPRGRPRPPSALQRDDGADLHRRRQRRGAGQGHRRHPPVALALDAAPPTGIIAAAADINRPRRASRRRCSGPIARRGPPWKTPSSGSTGPQCRVRHPERRRARPSTTSRFSLPPRQDAGAHRRERLRQDPPSDSAILNLLPHPGRITGGRVLFDGRDLLALTHGGDAPDPRPRDRHGLPGPAAPA